MKNSLASAYPGAGPDSHGLGGNERGEFSATSPGGDEASGWGSGAPAEDARITSAASSPQTGMVAEWNRWFEEKKAFRVPGAKPYSSFVRHDGLCSSSNGSSAPCRTSGISSATPRRRPPR